MIGSIEKGIVKKKTIKTEDHQDYLVRYTILNCKWFSVKIHKILKSDDLCLHDHPWTFYSLMLRGGYWEHTPPVDQHQVDITSSYDGKDTVKKWIGPFNFIKRPAHWIHRLEIPEGKYALTFVVTLKKAKTWGFYTPKFGFIDFKQYRSTDHCE